MKDAIAKCRSWLLSTKPTLLVIKAVSLILICILFSSPFWSQKKASGKVDAVNVEQPLYVVKLDSGDTVVKEDGTIAEQFAVDENGNVVRIEDGKVEIAAKDVKRAVVIREYHTIYKDKTEEEEEALKEFPFEGLVTGRGVRLRAIATTEARIVAELLPDEHVQVIGVDGDWYEVTWQNGDTEEHGFIYSTFVRKLRTK